MSQDDNTFDEYPSNYHELSKKLELFNWSQEDIDFLKQYLSDTEHNAWQNYYLIQALLKHHAPSEIDLDFSKRVMCAIDEDVPQTGACETFQTLWVGGMRTKKWHKKSS